MDENKKSLAIPISIFIAAIIIGGTLYYTRKDNIIKGSPNQIPPQKQEVNDPKEITADDHILGNADAPLTLLVYTDFECPFCKKFHETIMQLMDDYGRKGKVRLVFRHFPLETLHTKSKTEAEATECAAELGGENKFWDYTNALFKITPSNDLMDLTRLPEIADSIGLNKEKFTGCLESGKFAQKIDDSIKDAVSSGGQGTPYFIIINKKGEKFPINGALSYQELKLGIDQLLSEEGF